jgi:hypothetical protein
MLAGSDRPHDLSRPGVWLGSRCGHLNHRYARLSVDDSYSWTSSRTRWTIPVITRRGRTTASPGIPTKGRSWRAGHHTLPQQSASTRCNDVAFPPVMALKTQRNAAHGARPVMGTLPASFALHDASRGASSSTHKFKCDVAVSHVKQHSRASVFPLRRRPAIQLWRVQSVVRTQTILCTFASCADVCCTLESCAIMSGEAGSAASDVAGRPRRTRTLNVLHGDYVPTDLALAPVGRSAHRAQAAAASAPGAASAEVAAPTSVPEQQKPPAHACACMRTSPSI